MAARLTVPPLEDLDRRDPHPFLVDVGREARVAPRHHAADVHPVGPHRGEDEDVPVLVEDGMDQGHVVQVGAAPIGVVQQHHVAWMKVVAEVLEHATHPPGQGEHVPRMVPGLRDHLSARPEQRTREVVELVDDGRERGADDGRPHLAHDRDEPLADHLQGDRVHVPGSHPEPRRRRPGTRTRAAALIDAKPLHLHVLRSRGVRTHETAVATGTSSSIMRPFALSTTEISYPLCKFIQKAGPVPR